LAAVLFYASLTAPLVNLATNVIGSLGYAGVTLLTITTGVIAVPGTEPTMLFAGFDVYKDSLSLPGIIVFGVLGDLIGATIAYSIGYYGSEELIERHGSKFHISSRRFDRAHGWFEQYGTPTLFISRLLPVVRSAFPYAAGVAEVPFKRFLLLTTLGSIPWITGLAVLGREVGSKWQTWRHHLEYVDYVGAVVVVAAIVYLIVRRMRTQRAEPAERADPAVDVVSK
jgi:membrane protein DedA with SNARE-associated domain